METVRHQKVGNKLRGRRSEGGTEGKEISKKMEKVRHHKEENKLRGRR